MSSKHRYSVMILINLCVFLGLAAAIEGFSSYALLLDEIRSVTKLAERHHTIYDPELGWVNRPDVHVPDMYGPGIYLQTNKQGFRNTKNFSPSVPEGRIRVICSGDSFTLGYGVDNKHTWPMRLGSIDPRLEPVNMGQGGYGVDQAYLWFKRDAAPLDYDFHILAFITADFADRMQPYRFFGYGKPVIKLQENALVVTNTPVATGSYQFPGLTRTLRILCDLQTIKFLRRGINKMKSMLRNGNAPPSNTETQRVLVKILEDLKNHSKNRSGKLILAYLPTEFDLKGSSKTDKWTEFMRTLSCDLDIPLVNVVDSFRSLPYERVSHMFLADGELDYLGAAGHLNNEGNEAVAKVIYEELKAHL